MTQTQERPEQIQQSKVDLPTNKDVIEGLEMAKRVEAAVEERQSELSATGKAILRDTKELLETTEQAIREKNQGELLQETVKHAFKSGSMSTSGVGGLVSAMSAEEIGSELHQGKSSAITIANLLLSSSELRDAISDLIDIVQSYLNTTGDAFEEEEEEKVNAQAKTLISDRFYGLVNDLQGKSEFQQSIHTAVDALAALYEQIKTGMWQQFWSEGGLEELKPAEREAKEAMKNAQKLLENWARTSMDSLIDTLVAFVEKIKQDQQFVDSIEQFGHFLNNCLVTEGYLNDKDWIKNEFSNRFDNIKATTWGKYYKDLSKLFHQVSLFMDKLGRDPTAVNLKHDLSSLYQNLFLDSEGRPAFKPELVSDLKIVIPALLRQLIHLRSPDVHYSDDQIDFDASNVVMSVSELTPSQLKLTFVADLESMQRDTTALPPSSGESSSLIKIEVFGIHAAANGLLYSLNKHHGFPLWKDSGYADLRIYGRGMDIGILMEPVVSSSTGKTKVSGGLRVCESKCVVHALDLNLYDTQHDWLYSVIGPIVRSMLKSRLEKAVVENLKSWDLTTTIPVVGGEKVEASALPTLGKEPKV